MRYTLIILAFLAIGWSYPTDTPTSAFKMITDTSVLIDDIREPIPELSWTFTCDETMRLVVDGQIGGVHFRSDKLGSFDPTIHPVSFSALAKLDNQWFYPATGDNLRDRKQHYKILTIHNEAIVPVGTHTYAMTVRSGNTRIPDDEAYVYLKPYQTALFFRLEPLNGSSSGSSTNVVIDGVSSNQVRDIVRDMVEGATIETDCISEIVLP